MKKIIVLSVLALILLQTFAIAQGGSTYTIFGIGDKNYGGNSAYEALSGTSAALWFPNSINLNNPALWTKVKTTRLETGYTFSQFIRDQDPNSVMQNNGGINSFNCIFALDTASGITASLGIMNLSKVSYQIASVTSIEKEGYHLDGQITYTGSGGINAPYFGLAMDLPANISIGAMAFYKIGNIVSEAQTSFLNDPYAFTYYNRNEYLISGLGMRTGIYAEPIEKLGIGAYYEFHPTTGVENRNVYDSEISNDTTLSTTGDIKLPSTFGIGASYQIGWTKLGLDFFSQDFTGFDFRPGAGTKYTNSWGIDFGAAFLGSQSINANAFERIDYKVGLSYKQLYYEVLGNQITEMSGSFGMQIPWNQSLLTDLSFTAGMRGTNNNGLVREYFFRFDINVSIGEIWFIPFRRDY